MSLTKEEVMKLAEQCGFELIDIGSGDFLVEDISLGTALFEFAKAVESRHSHQSIIPLSNPD
jgi:hypothetical protein